MEIKIEAQTVVANEGGFEPHPESYTPRVFAAVWERGAKVYEILQNGHAIPWPCLPILEGFDYWVLYVEHLADVDMHRAPKKAGFGPSNPEQVGKAVDCNVCGRCKAPRGRSVPLDMANSLCDDECEGYNQSPLPGEI